MISSNNIKSNPSDLYNISVFLNPKLYIHTNPNENVSDLNKSCSGCF